LGLHPHPLGKIMGKFQENGVFPPKWEHLGEKYNIFPKFSQCREISSSHTKK